jgi:(S)-mandelate dehydrogenase
MFSLDRCYSVADLREAAKKRLPKGLFEFIDRGTEEEVGLAANREAFHRLKLRMRFLVDLTKRDMGTELFGQRMGLPLGIAPTGIAGLCWYQGELGLAKAAAEAKVPFTLASTSLTPMDTIVKEAGGRLWFQQYMWKESHLNYEMIARARDLGFEALVVTIDTALGRLREHNERNGFVFPFRLTPRFALDMLRHPGWLTGTMFRYFARNGFPRHENYPAKYQRIMAPAPVPERNPGMTWDEIDRLRKLWPRKLIIKSILSAEDAKSAVDHGADAVVVSNHGGRAMDSAIATIDILPEVVAEVGNRTTVLLDSGVRRGSDIVKALALGAKAVLIGRATLYGTAVAGQDGAAKAIQMLGTEFEKTMGYVGCRNVGELSREIFASQALRNGR